MKQMEIENEFFKDWSKLNLDGLVKALENRTRYQSDGESYAINRLIDFYKINRNKTITATLFKSNEVDSFGHLYSSSCIKDMFEKLKENPNFGEIKHPEK